MESQKQVPETRVYFGYGVKNGSRGAVAIVNPPHPPKRKEGKKNTQRREDSNPLMWSPTVAVKLNHRSDYVTLG